MSNFENVEFFATWSIDHVAKGSTIYHHGPFALHVTSCKSCLDVVAVILLKPC